MRYDCKRANGPISVYRDSGVGDMADSKNGRYCRVCSDPMYKEDKQPPIQRKKKDLIVRISYTIDGSANTGDVCLQCLLSAMKSGEYV